MNKMTLCSFLKKRIDDDRYPQLLETLLKELDDDKSTKIWKFISKQKFPSKYMRMMYHLICLELMKDHKQNYIGVEHAAVQKLLDYHRANATITHDVDFANVRFISDSMTTLISKENLEAKRAWFQFYKESLILTATSPQYMVDRYKKIVDHQPMTFNSKSEFLNEMKYSAMRWAISTTIAIHDHQEQTNLVDLYLVHLKRSYTPVFFNQPSE